MTTGAHQAKPDFFERLIDKALGTDAAIAPRLRSLFEPPPGPNWLEESEHDATADAAAALRTEETTPPPPAHRVMDRDRGPPRDIADRAAGNEPSTVFVDAPIEAMPLTATPLTAPDAVDDATPSPPRAVASPTRA